MFLQLGFGDYKGVYMGYHYHNCCFFGALRVWEFRSDVLVVEALGGRGKLFKLNENEQRFMV